jgi:hypothetical protein
MNDMTPPPLKKYRLKPECYDEYDNQYATRIKTIDNSWNRQPFNDFTDNLLDDTHINRFQLLDAIHAYKAEGLDVDYPLGSVFEDAVFNYRPYQSCMIS